jgi:type VII secretion protein EccE
MGHPRRLTWVSLHLDPSQCPGSILARGGGEEGAQRTLASVTSRLCARVEDLDLKPMRLDSERVRSALLIALGVDGPIVAAPTGSRLPYAEEWEHWQAGGLRYRCYRVRGWSGTDALPVVVNELSAIRAVATTVTLELIRVPPRSLAVRVVVRVASRPEFAADADTELRRRARALGLRLTPLDGEHALGLLAGTPLVGVLR